MEPNLCPSLFRTRHVYFVVSRENIRLTSRWSVARPAPRVSNTVMKYKHYLSSVRAEIPPSIQICSSSISCFKPELFLTYTHRRVRTGVAQIRCGFPFILVCSTYTFPLRFGTWRSRHEVNHTVSLLYVQVRTTSVCGLERVHVVASYSSICNQWLPRTTFSA